MFRNFDNWNRYYDLKGNVLYGCVSFMLKDGNTPAFIYDSDGTPLANPQITDILGRTEHQVFVNEDVLAYFYKYVGQGTLAEEEALGIDVSDETKWALQYTSESVDDTELHIASDSFTCIPTMDALRGVDPSTVPEVGGAKMVCLLGYYGAGDKQPVYYVYDSAADGNDDNGSLIQPDGVLTGRWRLVRPELHCDSRHFGVFPQDSQSTDVNHATRIVQLVDYCNAESLRPFFNGSESYPYFRYVNLVCSSRNPVIVSTNTVFVDVGTCRFFGDWEGEPHFANGFTALQCSFARASWNFTSVTGYSRIVLDDYTPQASFQDAEVIVTRSTAHKTFTNCTIVSDGWLGDNVFHNCRLTQSMFIDENVILTVDSDCEFDIDDFPSAKLWLTLADQVPGTVYDLREHLVGSDATCSKDNVTFVNGILSDFHYVPTTGAVFQDCLGSLYLDCTANPSLAFRGCEITLHDTASTTGTNMSVENSTMIFNEMVGFNALTVKRSVLDNTQAAGIDVYGPASIRDTEISCTVNARGNLEIMGCDISATVNHIGQAALMNLYFVDNTVEATGSLNLSSTVADTVINARIENNVGISEAPIVIDRTNLDLVDAHHTYTYQGNTGTFPPTTARFSHDLTITMTYATATQNDDYVELTQVYPSDQWYVVFRESPVYDHVTNPGFRHGFSGNVKFFRIGTDSFKVTVDWRVESDNWTNGDLSCIIAPLTFRMQANFVSGYNFKLDVPDEEYTGAMVDWDTTIAIFMRDGSGAGWVDLVFTGTFDARI